jgi:hypothetical protein
MLESELGPKSRAVASELSVCWGVGQGMLPDLTSTETGCTTQFEFQINTPSF